MEHPYFIPKPAEKFLDLERPIVFFDLETTGTNASQDRIIELCAIKLLPDGSQEERYHLIDPVVPIPAEATAIHGISNADVAGQPTFESLVPELESWFAGCDLGGYNIKRFDVPFLIEEFARYKRYPIKVSETKMVDVMAIYHHKEKRDLAAAVRFYCNREHEGAHGARADVLATIEVLKHQLLRYDDLKGNTSFLHDYLGDNHYIDLGRKFQRAGGGHIVYTFGKNKGRRVEEDVDYLKWIYEKSDFGAETRIAAQRIYLNLVWKNKIVAWLEAAGILNNVALAGALYTKLKFGTGDFPFTTHQDGAHLVVTYATEPPSSYRFPHKDALDIMLQLLDEEIRGAPQPAREGT
ncbi:MAG: 3'-5' exonuclease [Chitinophagaceae bacterium]|nr:MAG: 3'-5' exonuclease [Chitinophagaceae bacterium]